MADVRIAVAPLRCSLQSFPCSRTWRAFDVLEYMNLAGVCFLLLSGKHNDRIFKTDDSKSGHPFRSQSRSLGERKCIPAHCPCLRCLSNTWGFKNIMMSKLITVFHFNNVDMINLLCKPIVKASEWESCFLSCKRPTAPARLYRVKGERKLLMHARNQRW